eukprot:gene25411-33163_t
MRLIILNSSNFVASEKNLYSYTLPSSVKFDTGTKVGITSLSIFNSFFNITSDLGNNTLSLKWNANSGGSTLNITIPNGYYSVSDLNGLLQFYMFSNGWYMLKTNGDIVYFFELLQNASLYAVQMNSFPLPSVAQATALGYSLPPSPTFSLSPDGVTAYLPQLIFPSGFGNLIGFDARTYPSTANLTKNQSITSTKTPIINPVNSIIFTSNLINNPYAIPNSILMSMNLSGSIGTLMSHSASDVIWSNIASNIYNKIEVRLFDQAFNKLVINDPDMQSKMKYVPTRKGYVSLKPRMTGGAVNLLNELEDKPSALPPPPQNTISGVIREPTPLLRGGDLIS